jgi:pyrrolidone-carboxylate peptidase
MIKHSAFIMLSSLVLATLSNAVNAGQLKKNIEEMRVSKAGQTMPQVVNRYQAISDTLEVKLAQSTDELTVTEMAAHQGHRLWQQAVRDVQSGHSDDRSLYWSRLSMRNLLKQERVGFNVADWQRDILVKAVEKSSRGFSDITFSPDSQINILVTGFDPFFLDKNIGQSNPSGLAALALDGYRFEVNGKQAQIETVMIPVRFSDFDNGIIESLLTPFYRQNSLDMVFTISMGRDNFDIERFPGRNRSAEAPDNLNVLTGASQQSPKVPLFSGGTSADGKLNGPEFVQFSLPIEAMAAVKGHWSVNDNRQISTLSRGQFKASSLAELHDEISVEGSGGGYLSNEISYRSILLRDQFNLNLPVGHIHTPRIKGYDSQVESDIVAQISAMIAAAASTL